MDEVKHYMPNMPYEIFQYKGYLTQDLRNWIGEDYLETEQREGTGVSGTWINGKLLKPSEYIVKDPLNNSITVMSKREFEYRYHNLEEISK